jgi:hypothetical protein
MFGLFNDEGLVEGEFETHEEATNALNRYSEEDDLHVSEICPDHPGQERDNCELCNKDT